MTVTLTLAEIEAAVDAYDAAHPEGVAKASARKSGRNPKWPWVAVLDYGKMSTGVHATRTNTIRGLAFATRDEAVAAAEAHIERGRAAIIADLAKPNYRALRGMYGLPREITGVAS